ncbi:FKBP-type peptidyl-prolyl cis-trans isomerase [Demequina zhanjiangensis]|uniref:Peptidyl-prolyl cis-trans isomerase n=1 Tax=Demequina zhanjiangensis TaxID=3051659 RepID=A0ABT8G1W0_9MICO|nr:FKBP-type peptidyl-prolyl cis-trans isomerase [Demequina sp. SYSU T00b26]MDN4473131.1 FKBP-type peptidyl-prolyl cis-trans isomerase [Demequina sp. SYSU T00b26]
MRRLVALALAAGLALTGCVSGPPDASASVSPSGDISTITVGIDDSGTPTLDFERGLNWETTQTEVMLEGDGERLQDGQPLLLDMYGESLEDGSRVTNSYQGLARSFLLAPELLGEDLYEALLDVRVGTRVLHVSPAPEDNPDSEPPIVLVIDVLPMHAVGAEAEPREDFPTVRRAADGAPTVTIPEDLEPPADVQVATLVQGTGQQVREGDLVLVNYTMLSWDGTELDSSWPEEIAPLTVEVGSGESIEAIEVGLLDQTLGSQIVILSPATSAYPDQGPVVLVVDILDVFSPEVS